MRKLSDTETELKKALLIKKDISSKLTMKALELCSICSFFVAFLINYERIQNTCIMFLLFTLNK